MATVVLAVAAHPDDIEFGFAGTLALLRRAGCELHYMNVADGACGSLTTDGPATAAIRVQEAREAARTLGATFHPPIAADLGVFYEPGLLARLTAVVRAAAPDIVLTHSLSDYMEDHMNTARLAVTAAFVRGVPNFPSVPPRAAVTKDVVVYHAQPHGNRDPLNRFVIPDFAVAIDSVLPMKETALRCHRSQDDWLSRTQGMSGYTETMKKLGRELAARLGAPGHVEGWRRHNPLGFAPPEADPLRTLLADFVVMPSVSAAFA